MLPHTPAFHCEISAPWSVVHLIWDVLKIKNSLAIWTIMSAVWIHFSKTLKNLAYFPFLFRDKNECDIWWHILRMWPSLKQQQHNFCGSKKYFWNAVIGNIHRLDVAVALSTHFHFHSLHFQELSRINTNVICIVLCNWIFLVTRMQHFSQVWIQRKTARSCIRRREAKPWQIARDPFLLYSEGCL